MKLKAIWGSLFQMQNTFLIQKSMKPVDIYDETTAAAAASSSSVAATAGSSEYRRQREKNNESVRKSRAKNRIKLEECAHTVRDLQMENVRLNRTYEALQSELFTLKGLFQHIFPLTLKPTDIPTSTLHKIITSKDFKFEPSSLAMSAAAASTSSSPSTMPASPASSVDSNSSSSSNNIFMMQPHHQHHQHQHQQQPTLAPH